MRAAFSAFVLVFVPVLVPAAAGALGAGCCFGPLPPDPAPPSPATPGEPVAIADAPLPPTAGVPRAAADEVARARQAIAARDLDALRPLLADTPGASFDVGNGTIATQADAAIAAWRSSPGALAELDRALAGPCSAEPPDEGQVLVTCPDDDHSRSGGLFVMFSNMMDERESEDRFVVFTVGRVM
jgi:hypothetical protein